MEKNKTKFKVGDKVKILSSAVDISVDESEVGKVVEITAIFSPTNIMVSDSRGKDYGCWCVNDYNIAPTIVVGQQLLLWEWV